MKRALITGVTGQDGAYLSRLLFEKGYEVFGTYRTISKLNQERLQLLEVADKIHYLPVELQELSSVCRTIEKVQPDEIYNLGAQSFVHGSFDEPLLTADITALGPLRILEGIRSVNPKIKFYQASSSEMFGKAKVIPQNEETPFNPKSPYALSKLFGHGITVNYRESYGIHASSGILFNHESPLRGSRFVTKKIANGVALIKQGYQSELRLGNLNARRDWGYAREYVEAMWLMLQQDKPDDYVIATNESHSIREFVEAAFNEVDIQLEWLGKGVLEKGVDVNTGKVLVVVDPKFFRPVEADFLKGDYSKAQEKLNWSPHTTFKELARIMVDHELRHLQVTK